MAILPITGTAKELPPIKIIDPLPDKNKPKKPQNAVKRRIVK